MSDIKTNPKLSELLCSAAESMFPANDGQAVIEINTRNSEGDTPLHVFAWRGDVDSARVLIEAGADINAQGDFGETPLHVAIRLQQESLIILLLAAGAKTNICSEFNQTAQEMAAKLTGDVASLFKNRKSRRALRFAR